VSWPSAKMMARREAWGRGSLSCYGWLVERPGWMGWFRWPEPARPRAADSRIVWSDSRCAPPRGLRICAGRGNTLGCQAARGPHAGGHSRLTSRVRVPPGQDPCLPAQTRSGVPPQDIAVASAGCVFSSGARSCAPTAGTGWVGAVVRRTGGEGVAAAIPADTTGGMVSRAIKRTM
jgi:hypothetical protein